MHFPHIPHRRRLTELVGIIALDLDEPGVDDYNLDLSIADGDADFEPPPD